MLDVGSADGPSVGWLRAEHRNVTLDLFPEGLTPGEGVCGSATALPFADGSFDVVSAFDVVEHCEDEQLAIAELTRVLEPGGRMLLSVPAYQWAWSDHDVRAGHHRRYTRPRLVRLVGGRGCTSTGRRTRSARCSRSSPPSDSCGGFGGPGAGRRDCPRSPVASTSC